MLALIDGNNFYCSCERVFQPWLQNRPLVVLSNNDGCAISRSDEANALGIKMGAPYFQLRELCLFITSEAAKEIRGLESCDTARN